MTENPYDGAADRAGGPAHAPAAARRRDVFATVPGRPSAARALPDRGREEHDRRRGGDNGALVRRSTCSWITSLGSKLHPIPNILAA